MATMITTQVIKVLQEWVKEMSVSFEVIGLSSKKESPTNQHFNTSAIKVEVNKESELKIKELTEKLREAAIDIKQKDDKII